jgi:hypothetical protein
MTIGKNFVVTLAGLMLMNICSFSQGSTGAIAPSLSANSGGLNAQPGRFGPAPDARGWSDPAMNHNALLRDKLGDGVYVLIGTYKVMGSPYLFGQRRNADLFTPKEKAYNLNINYNTYNQEVEFYSTSNPAAPLIKEAGEVDSFTLKQDLESGITKDLKFVYGAQIGSTEKAYFQVLQTGSRYSLYKRYKSDLGYPSGNYGQADIRQFDLFSDYFYYDAETKKLKKVKLNLSSIIKEFKSTKDVTPVANSDAFSANPEGTLIKVINYLNS